MKYERALRIVKFIYSFNKYLNVSKVMQFKALVTQVATLMVRQSIISKEIQNMADVAKRCDNTRKNTRRKEMATSSSSLAWKIAWTEEPSGLQSTGWQKSRTQLTD